METPKQDIGTILALSKRFLPQFAVTKEDLLKPSPAFVINFYSHFLKELVNNCQLLLNCTFEDVLNSCPCDVDKEMFLFQYIRDILNKIGVPYFTLCDFYRPSDRTRTTMKVCLNFLFYIKESLPNSRDIVQAFNVKAEEIKTKHERIHSKKDQLSKIAYNTGILKEMLEALTKENMHITPSDIDTQLDSEIEKLEKEFEMLSANLALQKRSLHSVNEEIDILQNQIVTDNYESCNNELYQLQLEVKNNDDLISKNQKVLEEKEKELSSYNERAASIQKFDPLPLSSIEEVVELEQKIRDMEYDKKKDISTITAMNKMIETRCQKLTNADKNFQEELVQIKKTLSEKNKADTALNAKIDAEVLLQEKMVAEYQEIKEKLDASDEKCEDLKAKQELLENECKKYYERMLTCQNTVTVTFSDVLANIGRKK